MDQHSYYVLVKRLELDASVNHGAYRAKVLLISSAAYIVLFGVLLAIAALVYLGGQAAYVNHRPAMLMQIALLGLMVIPAVFVVLRMFFIRLPPPEGRYLARAEAPALFGALDKMRKRQNGPPIHRVLVNDDFNAAISQRPRWGLFGGHTNYLMLGLPFMLGMSPEEMLAVVAHEYGHVCGNHGKTSAWVYRQRLTFDAFYEQIEYIADNNLLYRGVARMLRMFMPYYDAYTFVLSREDEYEADRTATDMVGGEINAKGLIRGALLGRWIEEEFWSKLYKQADDRDKPAFMPFNAMRSAFKAAYPEWATQERLDDAWRARADLHDTHPALRERVEAIGKMPTLPLCVDKTAADVLLGATAKTLIAEFDRQWWEREKASWRSRYQYATRSKTRLRELSGLPLAGMGVGELHERAILSAEFESAQTAKALLERVLRQPGGPFPKAAYHYGCILLDEGDERGLEHLAAAANADRQIREQAARVGYAYLFRQQGEERAEEWWNRIINEDEEG